MAGKRMSPKKRSSKRKSPKKTLSPKMMSWTKKLAMWRKNHMRADGSLPSLKAAMKACKGRRVSSKKCRRRKSFRKHRKSPKAMTGAGRVEYHRYANADKHWKKKKSSKKSSKRKSPKSKSPKRKSPKRVSKKKTSGKRKSTRKVSKKKTSSKRKSTKKVSKKKNSPLVYKNMTLKDLQRRFKKIDTRPKTYEKTQNGTYPISWNIGSDLKENEIYTTDLNIFFHGNNGQSVTSSYTKPSYTLKKSEIRKIVRNIVKEEQKNRNIKKINSVATHFKPFLYRGKPEKGAMIADISIYHS